MQQEMIEKLKNGTGEEKTVPDADTTVEEMETATPQKPVYNRTTAKLEAAGHNSTKEVQLAAERSNSESKAEDEVEDDYFDDDDCYNPFGEDERTVVIAPPPVDPKLSPTEIWRRGLAPAGAKFEQFGKMTLLYQDTNSRGHTVWIGDSNLRNWVEKTNVFSECFLGGKHSFAYIPGGMFGQGDWDPKYCIDNKNLVIPIKHFEEWMVGVDRYVLWDSGNSYSRDNGKRGQQTYTPRRAKEVMLDILGSAEARYDGKCTIHVVGPPRRRDIDERLLRDIDNMYSMVGPGG